MEESFGPQPRSSIMKKVWKRKRKSRTVSFNDRCRYNDGTCITNLFVDDDDMNLNDIDIIEPLQDDNMSISMDLSSAGMSKVSSINVAELKAGPNTSVSMSIVSMRQGSCSPATPCTTPRSQTANDKTPSPHEPLGTEDSDNQQPGELDGPPRTLGKYSGSLRYLDPSDNDHFPNCPRHTKEENIIMSIERHDRTGKNFSRSTMFYIVWQERDENKSHLKSQVSAKTLFRLDWRRAMEEYINKLTVKNATHLITGLKGVILGISIINEVNAMRKVDSKKANVIRVMRCKDKAKRKKEEEQRAEDKENDRFTSSSGW